MEHFEIFVTISYTNSKLKGGQFNEKIAIIIILGPILRAALKNRGSANWPKIDNIQAYIVNKSKLKEGQFKEKNPNSCILGPI